MSTYGRLNKEMMEIAKLHPNYDISAFPIDEKNIYKWHCIIMGPEDTPYQGGVFFFDIDFPVTYPIKGPRIEIKTPIYHPNVTSM